jgi:hypothetical protein
VFGQSITQYILLYGNIWVAIVIIDVYILLDTVNVDIES